MRRFSKLTIDFTKSALQWLMMAKLFSTNDLPTLALCNLDEIVISKRSE
jgi:hypothetical protein